MKYLYFSLQTLPALQTALAASTAARQGELQFRRFPDGESYLRILSDCRDQEVVVLHNLQDPDRDILALLFLATALKQQGAKRVGLVAPYLAYMRQDKAFQRGEVITSRIFAEMISSHFDWLITVDPHLHRFASLAEIYRIPCVTLHLAPVLHRWIKAHIKKPLLIGPDRESAQWVEAAGRDFDMPTLVLEKQRKGDREVQINMPALQQWHQHTPVLVDDIIASGHTLLTTINHLKSLGFDRCTCVAIHGIFAEQSYEKLQTSGADVITTTTIAHVSNQIDISAELVNALERFLYDG